MIRSRRLLRAAPVVVFNVVVAALLAELTLVAALRMPSVTAHAPAVVLGFAQKVYRHFQRNLIQFDSQCARYDPSLGYTLRPGTCEFGNLEFSHQFRINSRGLRDEESALTAPDVIFLGDSQAMGWGVAQEEAMPQALARRTGLKVLNAAISSYGTVRERMLLDTLDRSALRAVVLQYCDNDSPENQAFVNAGGRLPIMSEARYEAAAAATARDARYYPGKYVFRLVLKALHLEEPEADQARLDPTLTPAAEARLFIRAFLEAGDASLVGVPIVVFEVNSNPAVPRRFIQALGEVKQDPAYPPAIRNMVLIETEGAFGRQDFYVIDDHLTAQGNDLVARLVARALADAGVTGQAASRRP